MSTTPPIVAAALGLPDPDGLSPLQLHYLQAIAAEPHAPSVVAQQLGIEPQVLAQWEQHKPFARRSRRAMRQALRRREMALALVSTRAMDRLAASLEDNALLHADQRRTCIELLKFAGAGRGRKAVAKPPPIELPGKIEIEEKARLIECLNEGEVQP